MLLEVTHITRYEYAAPVRESLNETRLQPLTTPAQRCLRFDLQVEPAARLTDFVDFYGNPVRHFSITDPHDALVVSAQSLTQTFPEAFAEPMGFFPLEDLNSVRYSREHFDFLGESRYVTRAPELWKTAVDIRGDRQDVHEITRLIMRWVYETFTYAPNTTAVQTNALEAFRLRRGVCQDYAHVMLALCRALEIPARYVSGYFFTPDTAHDPAAGASHAWVEVCLPGYGWLALDPTHDRPVDCTYIALAVGRDYQDIRPISGTYRGGDVGQMSVQVTVNATATEADLAGC